MNRWVISLAFCIGILDPGFARAAPAASRVQSAAWKVGAGAGRLQAVVRRVEARNPASTMTLHASGTRAVGDPGLEVVRVDGEISGVPVLGGVARVLIDRGGSGQAILVNWSDPVAPPKTVVPGITASSALRAVVATGTSGSVGAHTARLVVVPGRRQSWLAWEVDPPVDPRTGQNPVFWVDAHTGAVRVAYDHSKTALARAFFTNPVRHPAAEDYLLNHVDEVAPNLEGPFFRATNCVAQTVGAVCNPMPTAVPDVNGDFLFPAPDVTVPADHDQLEDTFAEVHNYYHADKFLEWLTGLGFAGFPCTLAGERVTLVANFRPGGDPFANAVYTGDCNMTVLMGQGEGVDFAYDGDVMYHELGHGIVDQQMGDENLGGLLMRPHGVSVDPGSLNEGFSDFFSSSFAGDPIHGDYLAQYSEAGRDNGNDFKCPSGFWGEVHGDSEPWAAALLEIHGVLGDSFVAAVIDSIAMLQSDASFEEAAAIVEAMTRAELGDSAAATVAQVFAERNLVDCPRFAPYQDVTRDMWLYPPSSLDHFVPMMPPPYQVMFEAPDNAIGLTLTWEVDAFGEIFDISHDINLLVKSGAPVTFEYTVNPSTVQVDANPDANYPSLEGSLEIPVEPGEVLYGAFFNLGVDLAIIKNLQVQWRTIEGGDDGAETGSDTSAETGADDGGPQGTSDDGGDAGQTGADDGGCGCRSGRPMPPGGLTALSLLALGFVRRRRRARDHGG